VYLWGKQFRYRAGTKGAKARKKAYGMQSKKQYTVAAGQKEAFYNRACLCIGTGHMSHALQKEYLDQLALVQREIGFQYIRGHGLFCDDMGICQKYKDADGKAQIEYNFTYLDRVMDAYRNLGLKPFLELGFMPGALARGSQTVFYYKGNVTPPKSYDAWCDLVTATLRHLMQRYGADEVVTWPVEVWNEPNLAMFWKNTDQAEYFWLFARTFAAVKALDVRFQVGGPAVCDIACNEWIKAFLAFCDQNAIRPDFLSRHHYTAETPQKQGHYGYVALHDLSWAVKDIHSTRTLIDKTPGWAGTPLHLTEFNTSYISRCPLHDTNRNAAVMAHMLSWLGDDCASYSYWTFGDVFEEEGAPFTPFHGGFGLVANGCIPKPTFWTFAFFARLGKTCVLRREEIVVTRTEDGSYRGIAWNCAQGGTLSLEITLPAQAGEWCLMRRTSDEETCNPLKVWHDLGEPAYPSEEQTALLRASAVPPVATQILRTDADQLKIVLSLRANGVEYFELSPRHAVPDRGYDYSRAART
jgi:xylan 1,4-beta-xylosidase